MHNPGHDSELEQMSREAAGNFHPPGLPDWDKMERALDEVMPVEKKKRRFGAWWLLPVLLGAGVLTYQLFSEAPANDTLRNIAVNDQPADANVLPKEVPISESQTNQAQPAADAAVNTTIKPSGAGENPEQHSSPNIADNYSRPAKVVSAPAVTGKEVSPVNMVSENKATAPASSTGSSEITKTINGNDHQQPPVTATGTAGGLNTPVNTSADAPVQGGSTAGNENNNLAKDSAATATGSGSDKATVSHTSKRAGKGFSVAIMAGMDMSTVKFRYGNDPGFNAGIIGGYHFNKHWSVHTGVLYTRKNYKLAGADFTAPKGSWASYYKLTTVAGYCSMFEVPILGRYAIAAGNRNSYFISTGLSSYFMTHENYSYSYYYMGNPATRTADYSSSDKHILAIMHLSAGFERKLTSTLSLQVEPYAKLPLAGVGMGQIKLSSFGINFGLQLRQPTKR